MLLKTIKRTSSSSQPEEEFVWDPNEPLKAGAYAMALRGPLTENLYDKITPPGANTTSQDYNLAIREHAIVKILSIVGDFARVRRFRKSTPFRKYVALSDLKRVLAVNVRQSDDEDLSLYILDPVRFGYLSEMLPAVWAYLGERLNELYGDHFAEEVNGKYTPKYDPQIIVANFLQKQNAGTDGFMVTTARYGKIIFVNSQASNVEMIAVHEYMHQIGMQAARAGLNVGDWMYEADQEINRELERHKIEEMEEGRPDEEERVLLENQNYFTKATERKAHGEQMLWLLYDIKKQEVASILAQLKRGKIIKQQADEKISTIESRDPESYRKDVMNKMRGGRASSKHAGQTGFETHYNDIFQDYVVDRKWEIQKEINQELKDQFPELDNI